VVLVHGVHGQFIGGIRYWDSPYFGVFRTSDTAHGKCSRSRHRYWLIKSSPGLRQITTHTHTHTRTYTHLSIQRSVRFAHTHMFVTHTVWKQRALKPACVNTMYECMGSNYTSLLLCVRENVFVCVYTYIHTHTHTCIYIYIYICIHTYKHE
jgi:hypothetical protein